MFQYELRHYINTYKKPLIIWGSLLIILLSIVGFAVWQQKVEDRRGKIAVPIKTVPADATVRIGEKTFDQGTQYVDPGSYTVIISSSGFHPTEQKIRIYDTLPAAVYVSLTPATDEAEQWRKRHNRDYDEIARLRFGLSQDYGEAFKKRWPIVDSLPIKDPYFTISYKNVDNGELVITIRATSPRYRELAIDHLRTKGFEPTNYRFEVVGFKNPLQEQN